MEEFILKKSGENFNEDIYRSTFELGNKDITLTDKLYWYNWFNSNYSYYLTFFNKFNTANLNILRVAINDYIKYKNDDNCPINLTIVGGGNLYELFAISILTEEYPTHKINVYIIDALIWRGNFYEIQDNKMFFNYLNKLNEIIFVKGNFFNTLTTYKKIKNEFSTIIFSRCLVLGEIVYNNINIEYKNNKNKYMIRVNNLLSEFKDKNIINVLSIEQIDSPLSPEVLAENREGDNTKHFDYCLKVHLSNNFKRMKKINELSYYINKIDEPEKEIKLLKPIFNELRDIKEVFDKISPIKSEGKRDVYVNLKINHPLFGLCYVYKLKIKEDGFKVVTIKTYDGGDIHDLSYDYVYENYFKLVVK